jgi:hypothetical protein
MLPSSFSTIRATVLRELGRFLTLNHHLIATFPRTSLVAKASKDDIKTQEDILLSTS